MYSGADDHIGYGGTTRTSTIRYRKQAPTAEADGAVDEMDTGNYHKTRQVMRASLPRAGQRTRTQPQPRITQPDDILDEVYADDDAYEYESTVPIQLPKTKTGGNQEMIGSQDRRNYRNVPTTGADPNWRRKQGVHTDRPPYDYDSQVRAARQPYQQPSRRLYEQPTDADPVQKPRQIAPGQPRKVLNRRNVVMGIGAVAMGVVGVGAVWSFVESEWNQVQHELATGDTNAVLCKVWTGYHDSQTQPTQFLIYVDEAYDIVLQQIPGDGRLGRIQTSQCLKDRGWTGPHNQIRLELQAKGTPGHCDAITVVATCGGVGVWQQPTTIPWDLVFDKDGFIVGKKQQ